MYLRDWAVRQIKLVLVVFPRKTIRFFQLLTEFTAFRKKADKRFSTSWSELYPCLADSTGTTPFDQHYIYHPAWAARVLAKTKPELHIDISSILSFSSIVSAFVPVRFYDYRPAELNLPGLQSERADLLKLPFEDQSIDSLSCMHTIEHIGLGRYGDPLDPQGDLKAMNELKRVLKPGGSLLFVTPVGKPKIAFNAHRVYGYEQILESFAPLQLQEFSLVPDTGGLLMHADPALVSKQDYGCGCFWFKNPLL
jgi:SAM-dependent methyltransferase